MRRSLLILAVCSALAGRTSGAAAERLRLVADGAGAAGTVKTALMQPVDIYLVAERDTSHVQMSAVVYTLELPDGVLLVGEELLVESVLGLGTSVTGINLVFRCVDGPSLKVQRFRVVATRPVQNAVVVLRPDTRTKFLGIVSCRDENFAKFACAADSVRISTR
jgi:hypothetical protein